MKSYARICEGQVQEIFATDLDITQMFHPDMIWVDITALEPAPVVGWSAIELPDGWQFEKPVAIIPTNAELILSSMVERDARLDAADEATAGMADAYIAGLLEAEDVAKFKAFAAYKLALNKIDKQPGYPQTIAWPMLPQ
jgi:hypothetical protein